MVKIAYPKKGSISSLWKKEILGKKKGKKKRR